MVHIKIHNDFVYITTNIHKTVLYIGITNDLYCRMLQHKDDSENKKQHFEGKYNVYFLVYWERFDNIEYAIDRETQIKNWNRKKKMELINTFNPQWKFLNDEI